MSPVVGAIHQPGESSEESHCGCFAGQHDRSIVRTDRGPGPGLAAGVAGRPDRHRRRWQHGYGQHDSGHFGRCGRRGCRWHGCRRRHAGCRGCRRSRRSSGRGRKQRWRQQQRQPELLAEHRRLGWHRWYHRHHRHHWHPLSPKASQSLIRAGFGQRGLLSSARHRSGSHERTQRRGPRRRDLSAARMHLGTWTTHVHQQPDAVRR